jgi:hypothetical protein
MPKTVKHFFMVRPPLMMVITLYSIPSRCQGCKKYTCADRSHEVQ